jgi:hypothetical protein
VQHRPRFKLLLAGSHTLAEFQRWSSDLINAQTIHLSFLAEAEALRLIERPIVDFALSDTPQASAVPSIKLGKRFALLPLWFKEREPCRNAYPCAAFDAARNES